LESKGSSDRSNVLLLIVDSVRSDFVGAYGAPRIRTPNIDALASQGVSFTRFFPEAMPTARATPGPTRTWNPTSCAR
jgi:arylsulfatase A-like enzyme